MFQTNIADDTVNERLLVGYCLVISHNITYSRQWHITAAWNISIKVRSHWISDILAIRFADKYGFKKTPLSQSKTNTHCTNQLTIYLWFLCSHFKCKRFSFYRIIQKIYMYWEGQAVLKPGANQLYLFCI